MAPSTALGQELKPGEVTDQGQNNVTVGEIKQQIIVYSSTTVLPHVNGNKSTRICRAR